MRSRIQDDTSLNGHVDRYLNGTIQWTFVSLMLDVQLTADSGEPHDIGFTIWQRNLDVSTPRLRHSLADITMNLGLTAYS